MDQAAHFDGGAEVAGLLIPRKPHAERARPVSLPFDRLHAFAPAPEPVATRAFAPDRVFTGAALTAEQRVLVECARALAGSGAAPPVESLLDADPELLVPLAWWHGMLPYLSRRVAAADRVSHHPSFAPLRAAFLENGVRALNLAGELANVVGILEAAGVAPLAYKGPALAVQAYGDASLRDCTDLDLVVRREELDAAGAALVRAGFRDLFDPRADRAALLRDGHHLQYQREGVLVEVHWRFGKSVFGFAEELSGLWDRAAALDIRGRRVRTLSVADHLLALAIHSSKVLWSSLEGTVSIVRLAARVAPEEWPEVVERAREWRCEEALGVSLLLAEHMLGAPCRRGLARHFPATPGARRLAARVAAGLFREGSGGPRYVLGQLALRPRYRDRLRFALAALRHAGVPDTGEAPRPGLGSVLARPLRVLKRYRG